SVTLGVSPAATSSAAADSETHRAIDAVWRIESARLIAGLARMVRDVGIAEELAQDALVAALAQCPASGGPRNPGAVPLATAKRTLAAAQVPFEVPSGADRAARLASVLEVIYLIFNEGYSATAGDDWLRPALCEDALRLGRVLAGLAPDEPEVHGLVALMEIQ